MDRIQTDDESQFNLREFQEVIYVCGVQLALAAPYHQEMYR